MLGRYTSSRMQRLWDETNKIAVWGRVQLASAEAQGAPKAVLKLMASAPLPTEQEVQAFEVRTRHDVVAFNLAWRKKLGEAAKLEPSNIGLGSMARRWVHRNMTSSDLVDTANAVRLEEAAKFIWAEALVLRATMATHALAHWNTRRVARTHGQTAEESTWGYRVADLTMQLSRAMDRFEMGRQAVRVGKLSGPVGDYKRITRGEEALFCRSLGLEQPTTATQVLGRDNYVEFAEACAALTTAIEASAIEIRLSARTDTGEVAEAFGMGQRGSSAMPHKRNPISSENLTGVARLVRAQTSALREGVAMHHERDISHSIVERVTLPLITTLTEYACTRAAKTWRELAVDRDAMRANLDRAEGDLWKAVQVQTLIDQGADPDEAWQRVANGEEVVIEWPNQHRLAHVRGWLLEFGATAPPQG